MKHLLILFLIFHLQPTLADTSCASSEVNIQTREYYTKAQWDTAVNKWEIEEPESPGLILLARAYAVYSREKKNSRKLRGDKRAHCYIGCKISQEVSFEAAIYAAWYKEYQDLTDCDQKTFFEVKDFIYSLKGAEVGQTSASEYLCKSNCQ